jgi:putative oxidoreductase
MDITLLLIRLVAGLVVAAHGAQKVLGWFGGHGIRGTAGFLESLGFRPGRPYAWLLGTTELAAGLALAAGLLTPLAGAAVAAVMLGAIATVHWSHGFFATEGGYEFPLVVALTALAPAFSGPGRWSVDHALGWTHGGTEWGVGAILLAIVLWAAVNGSRGLRVSFSGRHTVRA